MAVVGIVKQESQFNLNHLHSLLVHKATLQIEGIIAGESVPGSRKSCVLACVSVCVCERARGQ
jgi:hypothetical protein